MTLQEVMQELESYGSENTKKIYKKHGITGDFYGVKVGDMKKIVKKIKKDHQLAKQLYATNNSDAMYLAGLIADEKAVTKEELQNWVENAHWYMISEYTVPWLAAESAFGWDLAMEWMGADEERIMAAGWSTMSSYISLKADEDLDLIIIDKLLDEVGNEVHNSPNRVRYVMNNFVIAVGTYIASLTEKATAIAIKIGKVEVNVGETSCKVPLAKDYIQKVIDKDRVGKKRKKARC